MANNACVSLYGTVISEPTQKQVNNSTQLAMKVAVKTTKKQENSQYPASDIYDVAIYGNPADKLVNKIKAKTKIWAYGPFMMGEPWTDREGKQHINPKVTAQTIEIVSGGNFPNSGRPAAQEVDIGF